MKITTLGEIPLIFDNLRKASTVSIRNLYKLITGEEGDRNNRKRLRNFTGFDFNVGTSEFTKKTTWATETFSLGELVGICHILTLDYSGQVEEIAKRICEHLADPGLLKTASVATISEAEESEDDEIN